MVYVKHEISIEWHSKAITLQKLQLIPIEMVCSIVGTNHTRKYTTTPLVLCNSNLLGIRDIHPTFFLFTWLRDDYQQL